MDNTTITRGRVHDKVHVTSPCMVITCSKSKDQPGEVANPARGQLNKENGCLPLPVRA